MSAPQGQKGRKMKTQVQIGSQVYVMSEGFHGEVVELIQVSIPSPHREFIGVAKVLVSANKFMIVKVCKSCFGGLYGLL